MPYTNIEDSELINKVNRFLSSNGISSYAGAQIISRLEDALPFINMDFGESFTHDINGDFNKSMNDALATMLCMWAGISILSTEALEESKNAVRVKDGDQTIDLTRVAAAKREIVERNEEKYERLVKKLNWELAKGKSIILEHYRIWD